MLGNTLPARTGEPLFELMFLVTVECSLSVRMIMHPQNYHYDDNCLAIKNKIKSYTYKDQFAVQEPIPGDHHSFSILSLVLLVRWSSPDGIPFLFVVDMLPRLKCINLN